MVYSVILRILDGSFDRGFQIEAEIRQDRQIIDTERGQLLPQTELPQLYRETFTSHYPTWGTRSELGSRVIDDGDGIEIIRAFIDTSVQLEQSFQAWLKQADLADIQTKIAKTIPNGFQPIFILETPDNSILPRLPWHRWDWLAKNFPNTEIVLSRKAFAVTSLLKRLRILVVLGSEEGIDLKPDWDALQRNLKPVADLIPLPQPSLNQLRTELRQGCDALFFAGHSNTNSTGDDGWIKINNQRSPITINDIIDELRESINKGLKLVFLNSCNGLGIASKLSNLNVPYIIVMRQEIHNDVAVKFIEYCLKHLTQGESLTRSVSAARKELRDLEEQYLCASWMPVICQSREAPDYIPFPKNIWRNRWYDLVHKSLVSIQLPSKLFGDRRMKIPPIGFLAIGLAAALLVHNWISTPPNSDLTQSIGDRLLFEQVSSPDKKDGIQAFKEKKYDLAIEHFNRSLQSQPNDPESRIYINNAQVLKAGNNPDTLPIVPVISSAKNGYSTAVDVLRGAAIAQMDINNNGGIKGQKMLINIVIDNNDKQEAEKVARKLVKDEKVKIVIGHVDSNTSVIAAPIYQQAGLTMISPTSSTMDLKGQGKYIFRTVPNSEMMAQKLANHITVVANKKKLGFCYNSLLRAAQTFEKAAIAAIAQQGGQILAINCDIASAGFSPDATLQKIKQAGADGLLIYTHINQPQDFEAAKNLARAAQNNQLPLFGSHAFVAPEIKQFGRDFEGMVVVTPRHPDSPLAQKFSQTSHATFGGESTWRELTSYDALKAGAEGWNRSDGSRDSIQQKLHDPKFSIPGSSGAITFSQSGDRLVTSSIAQLQKSGNEYKFVLLPTPSEKKPL